MLKVGRLGGYLFQRQYERAFFKPTDTASSLHGIEDCCIVADSHELVWLNRDYPTRVGQIRRDLHRGQVACGRLGLEVQRQVPTLFLASASGRLSGRVRWPIPLTWNTVELSS
jgi:hypothetical protein